jgi:AmiR/NasT family two-component response regulator
MNQRHVTDEQAFDILRRTSQNTNRKLRDVAEDVIRGRRR